MLVHHHTEATADIIVKLNFSHLSHSRKLLRTCRNDDQHRWNGETLELLPLETREVDTYPTFSCRVYSPRELYRSSCSKIWRERLAKSAKSIQVHSGN